MFRSESKGEELPVSMFSSVGLLGVVLSHS